MGRRDVAGDRAHRVLQEPLADHVPLDQVLEERDERLRLGEGEVGVGVDGVPVRYQDRVVARGERRDPHHLRDASRPVGVRLDDVHRLRPQQLMEAEARVFVYGAGDQRRRGIRRVISVYASIRSGCTGSPSQGTSSSRTASPNRTA